MKIKHSLYFSMFALFLSGIGSGMIIILQVFSVPLSNVHGVAIGFVAAGLAILIKVLSTIRHIELEAIEE